MRGGVGLISVKVLETSKVGMLVAGTSVAGFSTVTAWSVGSITSNSISSVGTLLPQLLLQV